MTADLEKTRSELAARPELAGFDLHLESGEIHLEMKGERFARLQPATGKTWRMEYFHHTEGWQIREFSGSLQECLDYLLEQDHFRFWNR